MKGKLLPSFVVTVALTSGCGGAPTPPNETPPDETPIPTNPPGPDGEPGIGDGAGPPPLEDAVEDDTTETDAEGGEDELPPPPE